MPNKTYMNYVEAYSIAEALREELAPHCIKCEIAGSVRRKKEQVKDIEIVAIPKPYDIGFFGEGETGIATVLKRFETIKGKLPCKYTQRRLPQGINLDLFFADEVNWGLIYAIRTGDAEYSHKMLARSWVRRGYKSVGGYLTRDDQIILTPTEEDFFKLIGVTWIRPELRHY